MKVERVMLAIGEWNVGKFVRNIQTIHYCDQFPIVDKREVYKIASRVNIKYYGTDQTSK